LEVSVTSARDVVRGPLGHFTERSLVGLLAVTGAGVGFGLLIMLVRVEWDPLFTVDRGIAARLNDLVSPHGPLVTVLNAITDLGGRPVILWLVTVAAVGLLIRRQGRLAVYVIVTGVGALILDLTLKTLVDRLRPQVEVQIGSYAGGSFPSGHALGSMVAYGALLMVFLPALAPRWRKPAIALVTVLVVAIGLTRIALGVHFVSDVVGAWLLGILWLGVTAYAFRLWRRERGRSAPPLAEGLEPEAGRDIAPAPDEAHVVPHPRSAVAELLVGWVLVFGAVYGVGMYVSYYTDGTFLATADREVPRWFADRHTDELTGLSVVWSKLGDTHAILFVSMVFCPLIVAVWRRWRPVLFVALAMFGELSLFLASAAAVDRPRPEVHNLDGRMPTSSFPSGHIAATICLYVAIAILVTARTDRPWRWLTVALAVIMPVGVAVSRMYRGMHHPTDLLGAIVLSALWIGLLYWVLRPNSDVYQGNQPSIESEEVGTLEDEFAKATRTG
jgi:undecaprenyl-diphosphatase